MVTILAAALERHVLGITANDTSSSSSGGGGGCSAAAPCAVQGTAGSCSASGTAAWGDDGAGLLPECSQGAAPGEAGLEPLLLGGVQEGQVVDMLGEVAQLRAGVLGARHPSVGDAHFVAALALLHRGEGGRALEALAAADACGGGEGLRGELRAAARLMAQGQLAATP